MEQPRRTVRIGDATWAALTAAARQDGLSTAELVREAVAAYLAARAERAVVAEISDRLVGELADIRARLERVEDLTGVRRR